MPALAALERIYRQRGSVADLALVLLRRGELAFDPAQKRAAFAEVATLRELERELDGAIAAWRAVLELDDGDREAIDRVALIYERQGKSRELVDTLSQAARFARGPEEELALRTRIARLETDALRDDATAVSAWQAVLDLDEGNLDALVALETVHRRREDWLAVQEVLTRRLELATRSTDKIAVYRQLAVLAEQQQQSLDDAVASHYQILELDNANLEAYAELERLLGRGERWHDLVELLERVAEVLGTLGHDAQELGALARAADVWEARIGDPDAAGDILEKILARDPSSVAALTRLAKIYERARDWDRCDAVLKRALALGPRGADAADLYYRLGEVARHQRGDDVQALAHFRQALAFDAGHPAAIAALESAARDGKDWATVADMLARRVAVSSEPTAQLSMLLELAELHASRLGDAASALPLLERAAATAPADPRVLAPLADLYLTVGRFAEAAPIYERLADEARSARRMKDVAKYRQRQGAILEASADVTGALAAYEEAFRVNPTDAPTMAGLGRIYLASRAWDKAQRVYRTLVLQNIDPGAGVTKAEVYLALGSIHVELGEAQKARGMFQRGLELEPQNPALKEALGKLG